MTKTVSIPVPAGLVTHGGVVNSITLREPTFAEFMSLGSPWQMISFPDNSQTVVENSSVIDGYLKACLVEPKDPLLLESAGLKVAVAVKGAVLGFFRNDESADAP